MYILQEDVEKKSRFPIPKPPTAIVHNIRLSLFENDDGQLYACIIFLHTIKRERLISGRCLCSKDVYEGAHIEHDESFKDKDLRI